MHFSKNLRAPLVSLAIGLGALVTQASAVDVYTSSSAFGSMVANGTTQTFSSYTSTTTFTSVDLPLGFSDNGFSYAFDATNSSSGIRIRQAGSTIGSSYALTTVGTSANLIIQFTSGNVNSVGGNFFNRQLLAPRDFVAEPVAISLTLSDSSTFDLVYNAADFASSFRGFISPMGTTITALRFTFLDPLRPGGTIANSNNSTLRAVDNLVVGTTVVPEPSTWAALAGLAVLGFTALCRTRRA